MGPLNAERRAHIAELWLMEDKQQIWAVLDDDERHHPSFPFGPADLLAANERIRVRCIGVGTLTRSKEAGGHRDIPQLILALDDARYARLSTLREVMALWQAEQPNRYVGPGLCVEQIDGSTHGK